MLQLTRLSGPVFALNPDLIERAEATPDTVVTLVNGSKYVIRESLEELIALVRDHRASVVVAAQSTSDLTDEGTGSHRRTEAASGRGTVVLLHSDRGEE